MVTQRTMALERANAVRHGGVSVKRAIRDGILTADDALSDPRAGHMTALAVLTAQHRWGRARAQRLLVGTGVPAHRRVSELTDRQLACLKDRILEAREHTMARRAV